MNPFHPDPSSADFAVATGADTPRDSARASRMLWVVVAAVAGFTTWAALFEIDQAVRTQGQFMPSGHTQVIQAVDGGVLARLKVHEGASVKAGQVLAELEPERAQAAYDESGAKLLALKAALIRAQAEASGHAPAYGSEFRAYPQLVEVQLKLHAQRRQGLDEALAAIAQTTALAREELAMNEALFATGDTSRVELLRAQRQMTELQSRAAELRNKHLQEARAEAARLAEDLMTLGHRQAERRDVLTHTVLTSPRDGVVKNLRITTVGGVLRGGDELMQISPTDGELLLEVRINPADIGQLRLGQRATLRLDAFDYTINGVLEGELSYLGADTLTEQGPGGAPVSFYRGRISLDKAAQARNPQLAGVALKPGMTATVDILTGRRSVLAYLMKPIAKAMGGALIER